MFSDYIKQKQIDTPVLLMLYNRPDLSYKVFQQIRNVRPTRLYFAVDGPKEGNRKDALSCEQCRQLVHLVDWPCEVKVLFREKNRGCKAAIIEAITWFFKHEEEGIILEDDCLPDTTFFYFCQELLEYYRDDHTIGHIGGCNFQEGNIRGDASYYFGRLGHSWGWATWRRAWNLYDPGVRSFPEFVKEDRFGRYDISFAEKLYWFEKFDKCYKDKVGTWDYQWLYTMWNNGLKSITPNHNLVSNIGFDNRATHTKKVQNNNAANMPTRPILVITHPHNQEINKAADQFSYTRLFKRSFAGNVLRFMYYLSFHTNRFNPFRNVSLKYIKPKFDSILRLF